MRYVKRLVGEACQSTGIGFDESKRAVIPGYRGWKIDERNLHVVRIEVVPRNYAPIPFGSANVHKIDTSIFVENVLDHLQEWADAFSPEPRSHRLLGVVVC